MKFIMKRRKQIVITTDRFSAEVRLQEYKEVAYNNSILAINKSEKKHKRPFLNKLISALTF